MAGGAFCFGDGELVRGEDWEALSEGAVPSNALNVEASGELLGGFVGGAGGHRATLDVGWVGGVDSILSMLGWFEIAAQMAESSLSTPMLACERVLFCFYDGRSVPNKAPQAARGGRAGGKHQGNGNPNEGIPPPGASCCPKARTQTVDASVAEQFRGGDALDRTKPLNLPSGTPAEEPYSTAPSPCMSLPLILDAARKVA
ncbi:hypothetical protein BDK51DRAFT_38075 [Blyttiomyces helicus]|uniref:Uncharacterized protein n=1 Tax=Blyttiomyces helicus TaxID=388810 RepID=A0A4P9WAY4_9FUNG|nr:hypothetical protein BDK51DRAFT_38075 [Blyttiomyces helicus]|eukprot:RKO87416.1 hypothetical protein BDK51DRAFT_38075 [Blyttiomyces helicus]